MADVAAIFVLFEAIWTVHHAHDIFALLCFALARRTATIVLLEAMFAEHSASAREAFVTLADVAAIIVLLEAIWTVHHAHDL